jgi:L-seryl-tRNA(Ser) seleniumtransferase
VTAERTQQELRRLPGVDAFLQRRDATAWQADYGREPLVAALREALEATRAAILAGGAYPGDESLAQAVGERLAAEVEPTLLPVINATGVVLHTNLGRAPLSAATLAAMRRAGAGYSNLEYDLAAGQRGSRYVHAEALLCRLTGAEAALLVNNNAAAVLLALSALARGRGVIISRGQLVEIGGGFRIPEVMAQSGARLVEVGTTNRTYIRDYAAAIDESTAALMRVHTSNYRIRGFTAQPDLAEMVALARAHGLLVIDDLGSGTLLDTARYGLAHEPTVQESVAGGADLVTFSGDKLLGGPQAGIIVGRAEVLERLRRYPLTRALRVDKTTIAGIQANLLHYLKGEAEREIPVWRMIAATAEEIGTRAEALLARLGGAGAGCAVIEGVSVVGGGSLPDEGLPTRLVAVPGRAEAGAEALAEALRRGRPAVVGRIEEGRLLLDLRTVLPEEEEALLGRLRELLEA